MTDPTRGLAFLATLLVAAAVAVEGSDHQPQHLAKLGWAPVNARGPGAAPWRAASPEQHGLSTAKLMVRRTRSPPVFLPRVYNHAHTAVLACVRAPPTPSHRGSGHKIVIVFPSLQK
jgi:hypothetical protein